MHSGIPKDKVTELQAAFKRRRTPWTPSQINRDEKLRLDARNYIFKCRAESGNTVEDEGKYDGDRIRRYKKWGRGVQEAIHGPNWAGAEKERPPRLDDEKPVANAEATGKKSPPAEADKENSLRDRKDIPIIPVSVQYEWLIQHTRRRANRNAGTLSSPER